MRVEAVHQFTDQDPVDVREMLSGETARKQMRINLMRKFIYWAYTKESKRWSETNNEERLVVYRHFSNSKFLLLFSTLFTVGMYNTVFRGIYSFRSTQLVNMRHVPFALKFGVSCLSGFLVARDLQLRSIYDPELYKVAIKYRTYYDEDYAKLAHVNVYGGDSDSAAAASSEDKC